MPAGPDGPTGEKDAGRVGLLAMQQAYLRGGEVGTFGHEQPTHALIELECQPVGREELLSALDTLLGSHETFRAVVDGDPHEGAGQTQSLERAVIDLSCQHDATGLADEQVEGLLAAERARLFSREFDPFSLPRFEVSLVWLGPRRARLLMAFDGMLLDGHGVSLFCRELDSILRTGEGCVDPGLFGYVRARERVDGAYALSGSPEADSRFWADLLDGCLEPPSFRCDADTSSPAPDACDEATYQVCRQLPQEAWRGFCAKAMEAGSTPFAFALTLYGHAVARYSGASDFAVSVPQRPPQWASLPEVMGMTSSFALIPFHDGRAPLAQLASSATGTLFETLDHAQLGGPELLQALARATGSLVQAPVTFTLMAEEAPKGACVTTRHTRIHTSQTLLETSVFVRADGSCEITLSARAGAVPQACAEGVAGMLESGIRGFAEGSLDETSLELPLSPDEQALVARASGSLAGTSDVGVGEPEPLSALLERSLARNAGRRAVCGTFGEITYAGLAAWCHALLRQVDREWPDLRRDTVLWGYDRERVLSSVGANHQTVGLLLPKGHLQVVASIACLLGSVSYMPISPNLPAATIAAACENAGVTRIVASQATLGLAREVAAIAQGASPARAMGILAMREDAPECDPGPDEKTLEHLSGRTPHLLCINTSGSTGTPKTISINDWALTNCLLATTAAYGLDDGTHAIALTNIGHDMSLFDTIGPILYGGYVVTLDERDRREPEAWLDAIRRFDVNTWSSVPAFMQMFVELGQDRLASVRDKLRTCIFGGDFLSPALCRDIMRAFPAARVFNCGGPSETTLWNISHEVTQADVDSGSIPYGRPFPGSEYWVCDAMGRVCPPGVRGVMCVCGLTLSNGYLRQDALADDGFGLVGGKVAYNTGDLGCYDASSGELWILGRDDGQVKVNGKRIELGGIEAVLARDPRVSQAVAVLHESGRIVAFVRADPTASEEGLRTHVGEVLPGYMVPTRVVLLDSLPLTGNTKVDRRRLSAWDLGPVAQASSAPAAGLTAGDGGDIVEDEVERVVAEALGAAFDTPFSLGDNFYLAGGDSIIAMRVVSTLGRRIGADLAVYDLLSCPDTGQWVDLVRSRMAAGDATPSVSPDEVLARVLSLVGGYLGGTKPERDGDFLSLGGDVELASVIARDLSREFGVEVSRYDLVFSPRLGNWAELVCRGANDRPGA